MPTREQYDRAEEIAREAIAKYRGTLEIAFVQNDYLSGEPKPCMGGWGRSYMCINPTGEVMPCHAAAVIPGLRFESVRDNSLGKDLARLAGDECVSRRRLDDGTVPQLRPQRNRFRRMPMPGLHAGGKCRRGRSDLPPLTASWDRRIDARGFRTRRSADLSRRKDQPRARASLAPYRRIAAERRGRKIPSRRRFRHSRDRTETRQRSPGGIHLDDPRSDRRDVESARLVIRSQCAATT